MTDYDALQRSFEAYVLRHFENCEGSFEKVDGTYRSAYIRGAFDMFYAVLLVPKIDAPKV